MRVSMIRLWGVVPTVMLLATLWSSATSVQAEDTFEHELDKPLSTRLELGRGWRAGLELTLESDYEDQADLDRTVSDRRLSVTPKAELALSFEPRDDITLFFDLELSRRYLARSPDGSTRPPTRLLAKELWMLVRDIAPGISIQLGRQDFEDEREWLYDQELDGLRIHGLWQRLGLELSVTREAAVDRDLLHESRSRPVNNYHALARYWLSSDSQVGGYVLYRDDPGRRREDLLLLGVRSYGELDSDTEYWLDAAIARGRSNRGRAIRGFGLDLGLTRELDLPLRPSLSLGFAFGSGDENRRDGIDRDFRQSGLQDNAAKLGGITSFKLYGEALEPELSNLKIATAGLGIRPTRNSSVDVVYHYYWQHHADDDIRDSNLDRDPDGQHHQLGHGLDLVMGFRPTPAVKIEAVMGRFFPGAAFADRNGRSPADPVVGSVELILRF